MTAPPLPRGRVGLVRWHTDHSAAGTRVVIRDVSLTETPRGLVYRDDVIRDATDTGHRRRWVGAQGELVELHVDGEREPRWIARERLVGVVEPAKRVRPCEMCCVDYAPATSRQRVCPACRPAYQNAARVARLRASRAEAYLARVVTSGGGAR